jgi:hypothetical protein
MAKIEFSQGFMSGLPARILKSNGAGGTDVNNIQSHGLLGNGGGSPYSAGSFRIFKGTKPTIAFIKNTTNARNAYDNDCLLTFEDGSYDLRNTTEAANPIIIKSIYKLSIKSGIAAWFYMARTQTGYDEHRVFNHAIIGDVGLIGSGADLELPDLNIISGNLYRIDNFKINLPSSWIY